MVNLTFCTRTLERLWWPGDAPAKKGWYYKTLTFLLTYLIYIAYHAAKRPMVILDNARSFIVCDKNETQEETGCDPVWIEEMKGSKEHAEALVGNLHFAYTFSYAVFMFLTGMLAERMDLRYYLTLGLLSTAAADFMFGLGHTAGIHSIYYFYVCQVALGLFNSTGWPGVVTVLSNWFGPEGFGRLWGHSTRGLMMGLWNTHMYVGNVLGLTMAARYADSDWTLSFLFPAIFVTAVGAVVFLLLVPQPSDVGLGKDQDVRLDVVPGKDPEMDKEEVEGEDEEEKAISFIGALRIPGVIEFSLCLFNAKLVAYVFLFWLPHYIKDTTDADAGTVKTLANNFEYGSMVGGVVAGFLADQTRGRNALICALLLFPAIPLMFIYNNMLSGSCPLEYSPAGGFADTSCLTACTALTVGLGCLINGPFSLITTAVSAELGQHQSIRGSTQAMATVAAIIDATGSIGAALGPLVASRPAMTSTRTILMLMGCIFLAILCLSRLIVQDVKKIVKKLCSL